MSVLSKSTADTLEDIDSALNQHDSTAEKLVNSRNTNIHVPPHRTATRILDLPVELIQQIFSYLSPQHLASLRRSCREFRHHAEHDKLWLDLMRQHLPEHDIPRNSFPAPSFCSLYLSHHPYWFLPEHRIWFSDDDLHNGKLIVARFDPETGSISGYRLVAQRLASSAQSWSLKPTVMIHHVEPRVMVSVDDPILSLTCSTSLELLQHTRTDWDPTQELRMRVGRPEQKISANLMLSKNLPVDTANTPSVAVWPPRSVPGMPRTRSSVAGNSTNSFTSKGHKPSTLDEISQTTFRMRTWSHFSQGMINLGVRVGEEVSTWSTLAKHLYEPSSQKPYQGLFVGDYASHGCEFLLVLQSEQAPARPRPPIDLQNYMNADDTEDGPPRYRNYLSAVLAAMSDHMYLQEQDGDEVIASSAQESQNPAGTEQKTHSLMGASEAFQVEPNVLDPDNTIHHGAIEAIKITGDVNVPRGEHTFIADDIGPKGLIRIAHEAPFRGARVVRSRGHVAARGFREDEYIPSQLFLISADVLAQYWLPFGHISFYHRVSLDDLLKTGMSPRRASE